ncbi:MAG TPA: hypothetical protein DCP71_02805, partial [Verrucomicrobiales bacterium]|nr:hypothetical protein [Verrucomicrobiales bacterium]
MMQTVQAVLPEPVLVKNIASQQLPVQAAAQAVSLGQSSLMVLDDAAHGAELWITDGTAAGTRLLKDIWPGEPASRITELTVCGDRAFFSADDGQHGQELWVTDGTEAGTQMAVDLVGHPQRGGLPSALTAFKEGLLFSGTNGDQHGLWWSDGTEAGTRGLLLDVPFYPHGCLVGGHFYFISLRQELWKTDGSLAGTVKIKAFPYVQNYPPVVLGGVNQTALLSVNTYGKGYRLWKSNGTPSGTVLFSHASSLGYSNHPLTMIITGGKTYVRADSYDSTPFWQIDSQVRGMRKTLVHFSYDHRLMPLGGKVLRSSSTTSNPIVHDLQTSAGIEIPHHSDWTGDPDTDRSPMDIVTIGTRAVFVTVKSGRRLMWVTDGTVEGTEPLSVDFAVGGDTNYETGLISDGTRAFFAARRTGETPVQWSTDGTASGTQRLVSLPQRNGGAKPTSLCRISDNLLYFSARDTAHGQEFWKSDGTEAGTMLLQDIHPGSVHSFPTNITYAGGTTAFFSASTPAKGQEVWLTDGVTFKGWDELEGPNSRFPNIFSFGSRAAAWDGEWIPALQKLRYRVGVSDSPGSYLFANSLYTYSNSPLLFTAVGENLYVGCNTGSSNTQDLYRYSPRLPDRPYGGFDKIGTFTNIRHMVAGPGSSPGEVQLYFTSSQGSAELYTCTATGQPSRVTLPYPGPYFRYHAITSLHACGNEMLFASNGTLWRSSRGSLKAFLPSGTCTPFTVVGDVLYYLRDDLHGRYDLECIRSDGSGRQILLRHGFDPALTRLHEEAGTLYFARRTSATGPWTLWQSQGTPESTLEIPHSRRTEMYGDQDRVVVLGDRLFFSGENPTDGRQMYSLDLSGRLEVTDVTDTARPRPLENGSVVDLDISPEPRILRLRNAGQRSLG